jgi:hypothetical protein
MAQQTALSWFFDNLKNHEIQAEHFELYQQAKGMELEQYHNYADFCVRCDRDQMKLLDFNDYMKIYTNGL